MSTLTSLKFSELELFTRRNVAFALASIVVWRVISYVKQLKDVSFLPGIRCPFEPFTFLGAVLPRTWWNPGLNFAWEEKSDLYTRYGSDTISIAPYLWQSTKIWTANMDVAKQVIAGGPNSPWIKPRAFSGALLIKGMNLAGAEGGEVWRRHRRIMGPAFNNKTFELVCDETVRAYKDMISAEGWHSKDVIDIPVVQKYTFKLALLIISACGFGLQFDWSEPPADENGEMSLQESLRIVSDSVFETVGLPKWAFKLPVQRFRDSNKANATLDAFMQKHVEMRRREIRKEIAENGASDIQRKDVFSRLVLANESNTEKLPLDDEELIGNTYVMLFAGHETTGHTLAATLGYLAVYQEEQEEVYQQVHEVLGNDRDPTYSDYPSLYKVLCAFYEALRLMPAGHAMGRQATRDTTLTIPGSSDKDNSRVIFIPKGLYVIVDVIGIQYNPKYFPEPYKYKPSRWHAQETGLEIDSFTAFSFGPRACIGRKFAMVEAVTWLSQLLRDWKVEIDLQPGEEREQWKERHLQASVIMTLAVNPVPIRLIRRRPR